MCDEKTREEEGRKKKKAYTPESKHHEKEMGRDPRATAPVAVAMASSLRKQEKLCSNEP
jgi:hypothetical protein